MIVERVVPSGRPSRRAGSLCNEIESRFLFYFFPSASASPGPSASLSVSCFLVVIGAFALTDERMAASSVDTALVLADRDRRSIIESDSHHVKRL